MRVLTEQDLQKRGNVVTVNGKALKKQLEPLKLKKSGEKNNLPVINSDPEIKKLVKMLTDSIAEHTTDIKALIQTVQKMQICVNPEIIMPQVAKEWEFVIDTDFHGTKKITAKRKK